MSQETARTLSGRIHSRRNQQRRAEPAQWRIRGLRRLLRKRVVWWVLVAALSLVTASTIHGEYTQARTARVSWGTVVPVVVAVDDVSRGEPLDRHAELQQWPAALVPPSAIDALSSGAIARVDLVAGEVLVEERVSTGGAGGLGDLLTEDTVAVAVPIHAGVPPLSIGDRVDLLATFDRGTALPDGSEATSRVARAAVVVDLGDEVVTVAIPDDSVAPVAQALARAEVTIALTGR